MSQVLVVDDDPDVRSLLEDLFAGEGFAVAVAADGYQAMEHIQRRVPDLIVSDIMMPRLSGDRMVELLRNQGASVPVILLTGMSDPPDHAANMLLRKPVAVDDLLSHANVLLGA